MSRLDLIKLEKSPTIGRVLRLDDISVIGVSSQTLAEEAIAGGRYPLAADLVRYYHAEMDIMNTILRTWIQDTMRFIVLKAGGTEESAQQAASGIMRVFWAYPFGIAERDNTITALVAQNDEQAVFWLERMRLAFLNVHDVLVAWMQDQLAFIAATYDENATLETILHTHQDIWGDRYAAWDVMTPWEKVALTVEGMRGGHFSGMKRRGDVIVEDQVDRYLVAFDPCGSGGVLRRGDPETGRAVHPLTEHGTNQNAHLWTWQKTDVHWYCSHCAIAMEWLPARKRGYLLRPLDHTLDHNAPCPWYIYKDDSQIRQYHYPRTGSINPATAEQPIVYNDWPFKPGE
jgi:hypothetical protein